MNVTREVILDLFPIYLAGEASPATRTLVEEYLKEDTELAQRLRLQCADNFATALPAALPPELELRSLRRTRKLISGQSWLLGLGIGFTALAFSFEFSVRGGQAELRLLLSDYPPVLVLSLFLALVCWIAYWMVRSKLRTDA